MSAGFEQTYRAELGYVLQALRRLGVPEASLEDAAHDVFLSVHARWSSYEPARPVRPWLFAFAARVASNVRQRVKPGVAEPLETVADPSLTPEQRSIGASERRLVHRALASLDDEKRAIFVLHELDQVPVPEAARALGLNVDTAWSRLRAARQCFNDACLKLLDGPEVSHE